MRYLTVPTTLLLLLLWAPALQPAAAQDGETYISGGSLPYEIRMTAVDDEDFRRRVTVPPRLSELPDPIPAGPSYTIRSPYWPEVLPGRAGVRDRAGDNATYFPDGGYVLARQKEVGGNGEIDSWLVLDHRQRAIIARYLNLGVQRLIPAQPSMLEILTVDAGTGGPMSIEVDSAVLDAAASRAVLEALAATPRPRILDPHRQPEAVRNWLTFTLPEGRSIQFAYGGTPATLTDYLGAEAYPSSPQLERALAASSSPAVAIPQDEVAGSPIWWGIAGVLGLSLLAAGIIVRRRLEPAGQAAARRLI